MAFSVPRSTQELDTDRKHITQTSNLDFKDLIPVANHLRVNIVPDRVSVSLRVRELEKPSPFMREA